MFLNLIITVCNWLYALREEYREARVPRGGECAGIDLMCRAVVSF